MSEAHFESSFWNGCRNSYNEETKQLLYMELMGFSPERDWRTPWNFDMRGRSVIDIGSGPCSILLKCYRLRGSPLSMVVDPMEMPQWVKARYNEAGLIFLDSPGEKIGNLDPQSFDLALIYNCLQHTDDPAKVVANARSLARDLAMFEWIGIEPHEGHPHMLTEGLLNEWAGRKGTVHRLTGRNECYGTAWVLPPEHR